MCAFIDRAKSPGLFACGLRHRPPTPPSSCNGSRTLLLIAATTVSTPNPLIEIHK
jgi:hypothetical protein